MEGNRSLRLVVVGALVAGAALVGGSAASVVWASPADAAPSAASSCGLGADTPTTSGTHISGVGSRTGCAGSVTLTVEVRKHRPAWPDAVVAENSRSGFGAGSLRASGGCDGRGTYFTETRSSNGNKLSSARVTRC
ncbi:hypothetical protein ABZ635_20995 [Nocardiopsis sp. NPDC007018]|uniref:hypothetical protein n=1 Tax=Nocardiopsis sp. NPDC007018 TaxID=3155721 RepID=UPI00340FE8AC